MNRNETYKDIDHIVGDFTSTNLLSINVDENSSFLENASKIQATLLEDLQHNTFTGVDLIREIRKQIQIVCILLFYKFIRDWRYAL